MRVAIVTDHHSRTADEPSLVKSLRGVFAAQLSPPELADVIISTSHSAAEGVNAPHGVPHICYVSQLEADSNPSPVLAADSSQRLNPMTLDLSRITIAQTGTQPTSSLDDWGVTHYLAGNGIAAAQLRETIGRPVKIIYPAVDTRLFRPQKLRRSEYYLAIVDESNVASLETAISASRVAGRELVVVTEPGFEFPEWGADPTDVKFVTASDQSELYQLLCEGRALVCLSSESFDPNVIRAQACGTPVIVPDEGGIAELVLDAEQDGPGTGLLFESSTPESIASTMLELERRPHKCSAMLASAHAQAFSSPRFAGEIRAFIAAVVASTVRTVRDESVGSEHRRAA